MNDVAPDLRGKSAAFIGLARDCARHLPYVLDNIHSLAALFERTGFVFAENDSQDQTVAILRAFGARRADFHLLNFDGIGERLPERTRRLAFLRNKCLSLLRADKSLRAYDYLIVMDLDDANVAPLDPQAVIAAFRFLEQSAATAGIFANSRGPYYDLWALREDRLCPGDVWEEALDYALAHRCDDATAYRNTFARRIFTLPETAAPLEVSSAFGGLGIYKMRYALKGSYVGFKSREIDMDGKSRRIKWQVCEHVAFNADVARSGGKLYVLPFLCNGTTQDMTFNELFFRSLMF